MLVTSPRVWAVLLLVWVMTTVTADPLGGMDIDHDTSYNPEPGRKGKGTKDEGPKNQDEKIDDDKQDHSNENDDNGDQNDDSQADDDKNNNDTHYHTHHHHHHHYYNNHGKNFTDKSDYKKYNTCRKLMCGTLPNNFRRHMHECMSEMDIVIPVKETVCPEGFKPRGKECFFVHEDRKDLLNWDESKLRCEEMGGYLAEPEDMNDFVAYIKENYSNKDFRRRKGSTIWLGATDRKEEGKWCWLSGGAVPEEWWKPWPDNQPSGDGNCMEVHYWPRTDFYMNDWDCENRGFFACEIAPIEHHHNHTEHHHHVSECGRPFRPNHPSQNHIMQLLSPYVVPALRQCILTKSGILNSWNNLVNRGVMMSKLYPSFLGNPELLAPIKEAIEYICPEPSEYEIHDFYLCVHKTCTDNIVL